MSLVRIIGVCKKLVIVDVAGELIEGGCIEYGEDGMRLPTHFSGFKMSMRDHTPCYKHLSDGYNITGVCNAIKEAVVADGYECVIKYVGAPTAEGSNPLQLAVFRYKNIVVSKVLKYPLYYNVYGRDILVPFNNMLLPVEIKPDGRYSKGATFQLFSDGRLLGVVVPTSKRRIRPVHAQKMDNESSAINAEIMLSWVIRGLNERFIERGVHGV